MKKVFQTVVDKDKGNCLQAVVASLFSLSLDEVPHFLDFKEGWFFKLLDFYKERGYDNTWVYNPGARSIEQTKKMLKIDGGVNGYWEAVVASQVFEDTFHAVVIDKNMNIVHDPNPEKKALKLGPRDILEIMAMRADRWRIDTDGMIVEKIKTKKI